MRVADHDSTAVQGAVFTPACLPACRRAECHSSASLWRSVMMSVLRRTVRVRCVQVGRRAIRHPLARYFPEKRSRPRLPGRARRSRPRRCRPGHGACVCACGGRHSPTPACASPRGVQAIAAARSPCAAQRAFQPRTHPVQSFAHRRYRDIEGPRRLLV